MSPLTDRRDRARIFRDRLSQALDTAGQNQSSLARAVGVDRSTISALLAPGTTRLPSAQLAADCAQALSVSCDWLLGLADRPEPLSQALAQAIRSLPASRALFDATIFDWHRAAQGFKLRHVPATLPDILKTRDVVLWEYAATLGPRAAEAFAGFQAQLAQLRMLRSDIEIALPLHELASFAQGSGYWQGLDLAPRQSQLDQLIQLCDELYPALRLHLFDAHRVFSAPMTVLGRQRAILYLGQSYLSFTDPDRVAEVSQHFDGLVREAAFSAREAAGHLRHLRQALE
jgi:transcriptional regulator with XRE-family HTH domain